MELCGFPHKGVGDACYFPAAYIQKYLEDFTDHFNLRQHIKVNYGIFQKISVNCSVGFRFLYLLVFKINIDFLVSSSCKESKSYQQ